MCIWILDKRYWGKLIDINSIAIDIEIISRNRIDKYHWAKKKALRQQYQILVRNQMTLYQVERLTKPTKCGLVIIGKRKRMLDFDNFVGGCKHLVDALTHEGFIWDDDSKHLGIPKFVQQKCDKKENPSTIIMRTVKE